MVNSTWASCRWLLLKQLCRYVSLNRLRWQGLFSSVRNKFTRSIFLRRWTIGWALCAEVPDGRVLNLLSLRKTSQNAQSSLSSWQSQTRWASANENEHTTDLRGCGCVISSSDSNIPSEALPSEIRTNSQTIQIRLANNFTNWVWSKFMVINNKMRSWNSYVPLSF